VEPAAGLLHDIETQGAEEQAELRSWFVERGMPWVDGRSGEEAGGGPGRGAPSRER
jgi:hypothetical protein